MRGLWKEQFTNFSLQSVQQYVHCHTVEPLPVQDGTGQFPALDRSVQVSDVPD